MVRFSVLFLAALIVEVGHAQPSTPVILISVDTLRADHLSCYQPGRRPTPHIDALARNGTLFSQASTPFPLTLPAHVALLSSTYPFTNGVEDNGVPLTSDVATLATVLQGAGYHTAAFVGSFVLDRRFGLNRGFDVYDGPIDLHNKITTSPVERKRAGSQTVQAATQWLERNASGRFFLFLHLYDLHLPYDLPADPKLRHGETGYSAELAYEDRVLGEFMAFLERRGLLRKALVVFTSDHGEGLGDHGESTHGYFIYQSTVHVPLIMHWPADFKRAPGARIDHPASLLDVAPTVLDAIGAKAPPAMRGHSLIGDGATADREIYTESLYARDHFGCAALRSVRDGRYKYIEAPKPELYDLAGDPNERHNLYDQQRARAASLNKRIAVLLASAPRTHRKTQPPPTPDTVEALRSLGYLSGSTKVSRTESRVDPKDRAADFERYYHALDLASAGDLTQSDQLLEPLAGKLPDVVDIRISLGLNRERLGDYQGAIRDFKRAVEQDRSNAQPYFELGFCYFRLGQTDAAVPEFKAALALEPWYTRADEALAQIYIQKKELPQARAHLNHLLTIDPDSYTAHYNLGIFAALEQNWSEAEKNMQAALRADPESVEAHDTLGKIYFQLGELEQAQKQFEETIRIAPRLASAHYNLAMVFQKQGKTEQAAQELRAAQEADDGARRR